MKPGIKLKLNEDGESLVDHEDRLGDCFGVPCKNISGSEVGSATCGINGKLITAILSQDMECPELKWHVMADELCKPIFSVYKGKNYKKHIKPIN